MDRFLDSMERDLGVLLLGVVRCVFFVRSLREVLGVFLRRCIVFGLVLLVLAVGGRLVIVV